VSDTVSSHEGVDQQALSRGFEPAAEDAAIKGNRRSCTRAVMTMASLSARDQEQRAPEHRGQNLYLQFLGLATPATVVWGSVWTANSGPEQVIIGHRGRASVTTHAGGNTRPGSPWSTNQSLTARRIRVTGGTSSTPAPDSPAGGTTWRRAMSTAIVIGNYYSLYLRAALPSDISYCRGTGATNL